VRSGLVDCIVSDHAPHTREKKQVEFNAAPFGLIGLETSLAIISTELVSKGVITWSRAIDLMSCGPARVLGIEGGRIAVGCAADITLIDPDAEWTIEASRFKSMSRNSPFDGRRVVGRAAMTIVSGEVRYDCLSS
jgi:dihydroorotase